MKFQDYWQIIKQRKQIVFLAFITTVLTTLVGSILWPSTYESVATIMLDYDSSNPMNMSMAVVPQALTSVEYINTQIELIKSRRISEGVVDVLHLDKVPSIIMSFNEAKEGNPLFFWRTKKDMDIRVWLADEFLSNHLKVEPARDSRFLSIKFYSPNPAFSAAVANAFAKSYTDYNLELKVAPFQNAQKWFSEKLKDVKGESDKATEQLRQYQKEKGVIGSSSSQGGVYDDAIQRLDQMNHELATAKAKFYESKVALNRVQQSKGDYESLPEVISNSFIQSLKSDRIKLETQLTELSGKVGTKHPQYVRLNSELETIKSKLHSEIANIVNAIKQDYASGSQRVTALESAFAGLKKEAAGVNLSRYEMDSLSRESDTSKQVYEALIKKYNETSLQSDINKTNVFVIDAAVPATKKYSPKIVLNLALAIFVGLFLGVGLAFFFDYLDDTVKSADALERQFGIVVLGIITTAKRELT